MEAHSSISYSDRNCNAVWHALCYDKNERYTDMKKILLSLILLLAVGLQAKDMSVAFVDMQYILKNLPQYEAAQEQLQLISKKWQREIDAASQEVQVLTANYQTEQIFMSESMRKQKEKEILDKEQQVLELRRKYFADNGELFKKREALLKPIQDDIYTAIQEVANDKRYDIVKDRSADPSLIYMSNKLDISDLVLNKLGAK